MPLPYTWPMGLQCHVELVGEYTFSFSDMLNTCIQKQMKHYCLHCLDRLQQLNSIILNLAFTLSLTCMHKIFRMADHPCKTGTSQNDIQEHQFRQEYKKHIPATDTGLLRLFSDTSRLIGLRLLFCEECLCVTLTLKIHKLISV